MKKYNIVTIIAFGILFGFFTGVYLYRINQANSPKILGTKNEEINNILNINNEEIIKTIETNNEEEKVSPNCSLILKLYYTKCEHLIEKREVIEDVVVNMNEQELRDKFNEWEVQKFTPTEIILYKEVNEFCDEHFLLKEKDGYIAIYKIDKNDNIKFFQTTEISTDYLTKKDLEQIKNGIKVYTEKELNKTLEDFE